MDSKKKFPKEYFIFRILEYDYVTMCVTFLFSNLILFFNKVVLLVEKQDQKYLLNLPLYRAVF